MFFRYHFNLGGGFECDTEQMITIFSPSWASTINVLECEWNVFPLVPFVDNDCPELKPD